MVSGYAGSECGETADARLRGLDRVCWRRCVQCALAARRPLTLYEIDGMIIVWAPTASPHASSYGSDLTPEDLQYEKEHWKPRTTFRYASHSCFSVDTGSMDVQVHDYAGVRPRMEPDWRVHHRRQHGQLRAYLHRQRRYGYRSCGVPSVSLTTSQASACTKSRSTTITSRVSPGTR